MSLLLIAGCIAAAMVGASVYVVLLVALAMRMDRKREKRNATRRAAATRARIVGHRDRGVTR